MQITVEMPLIKKCDVTECVYNARSSCHAKAITIGDNIKPNCDTFMEGTGHIMNSGIKAGVGACKVSGCTYNSDFECSAESINISQQGGTIHCMTFVAR